jgi:hypothetical protein
LTALGRAASISGEMRIFRAGRVALVAFVLLGAARASAFDKSSLEFERSIDNVAQAGLYHVAVDPALYRHARDDRLEDLRAISPGFVAEELVFRAPAAGAYTLYVGGNLPAPSDGLAAELARTGEQPRLAATFGTITPNPFFGHLSPRAPAPPPPRTMPRRPLLVPIALFLVALMWWTTHPRPRAHRGRASRGAGLPNRPSRASR